MMEEYYLDDSESITTKIGDFTERIHSLYMQKYGLDSARSLKSNAVYIFEEFQKIPENYDKNILMIGKVQSGKTSNLEMLSAIAIDNDYKLILIFGGYDNDLLKQTNDRFRSTFEIDSELDLFNHKPILLSSHPNDIQSLKSFDESLFKDTLDFKPIIISTIKRPKQIRQVCNVLKNINLNKIKVMIIDDEGDQASLNIKKDKESDFSSTYKAIVELKELLINPPYLSVTATPQANLFLDQYSKLKPYSLVTVLPGNKYCGTDFFHSGDRSIIEIVPEIENEILNEGKLAEGLRDAIICFLISTTISKYRNINYSEMLIHYTKSVKDQERLLSTVQVFLSSLKDIEMNSPDYYYFYNVFKNKFFRYFNLLNTNYDFNKIFNDLIERVNHTYVILRNSSKHISNENLNLKQHKIYIGGDMLQRGVTFKYLTTVYFTRWSNAGNMDTSLQRARWFGYRDNVIDLFRIFTTKVISQEFSNLCETEIDLWEQLTDFEYDLIDINDIKILSGDSKLKPFRKSVANYHKSIASSNWLKQRIGNFSDQLNLQNTIVESFIKKHDFVEMFEGRNDGKNTAKFANVSILEFNDLVKNLPFIFTQFPYTEEQLKRMNSFGERVNILIMPFTNGIGRERSFYDNRINNIHQGPDDADLSKQKFQGDLKVIKDRNIVNVQIHYIVPKIDGLLLLEKSQYMFAIYMPMSKTENYFERVKVNE